MKISTLTSIFLSTVTLVSGHARLQYPKPLGYGSTPALDGNAYNAPLKYDGSDFPCKGQIGVADMTPQATYTAGTKGVFKIWPNDGNGGEGNMAAHSGGSCQYSISFDKGKTWKVMKSFEGSCPRGAELDSNIASPNQTYIFDVPTDIKGGDAITAWTWIPRTGNRGEYYMNCCSVTIKGTGTSTLDDYPDMYLGEMVTGDIKSTMCLSTATYNLLYPYPGDSVTRGTDGNFLGPHGPGPDGTFKVCKAPGSSGGSSSEQQPSSQAPAPQPTSQSQPIYQSSPETTAVVPSPTQAAETVDTNSMIPSPTPGVETVDTNSVVASSTPGVETVEINLVLSSSTPGPYLYTPPQASSQPPSPSPSASFPIKIGEYTYECYLKS